MNRTEEEWRRLERLVKAQSVTISVCQVLITVQTVVVFALIAWMANR